MPKQLLFLPGASGNTHFWEPVAQRLAHPAERVHLGWPGFGSVPVEAAVNGIDDLVAGVVAQIDRPTALIGQSMGGVIALLAALQRPQWVTHLVLTVTSGGMDMSDLAAEDWREGYRAGYPALPHWFADYQVDLSDRLGSVQAPSLLLWGDADPLSPVAAGQRLAALLPRAELRVLAGGDHDLGCTLADDIAPLIDAHLAR